MFISNKLALLEISSASVLYKLSIKKVLKLPVPKSLALTYSAAFSPAIAINALAVIDPINASLAPT